MLGTLIVLLATGVATCQEITENRIIYDEIVWAFQVTDGSNVTMECQDSNKNFTLEEVDSLDWKRLRFEGNTMILTDITNAPNKYVFMEKKLSFSVLNVQPSDYGQYMCIARNATDDIIFQLQKSINFRSGPLVPDLTLKYKNNIITSVVATAVALLLILISCCVHRFKCRPETRNNSYAVTGEYKSEGNGYDNPYVETEDEKGFNKSAMEMQHKDGANGTEGTKTDIY